MAVLLLLLLLLLLLPLPLRLIMGTGGTNLIMVGERVHW